MSRRNREVKVAVTMDSQYPYLFSMDQSRSLEAIVEDIATQWKLPNPQDYALRFSEKPKRTDFITEKNRAEISDGSVMVLHVSPAKTVQRILDGLDASRTEQEHSLAFRQLLEMSSDITFAQEFIGREGHKLIISMIESGAWKGEFLSSGLKSFIELMDHGIVPWDVVDPKFIKMVISCVITAQGIPVPTVQSALEILESVVLHSESRCGLVEQDVSPNSLLHLLQSADAEVQKNALALINALFLKADPDKSKKIADSVQSKVIRNAIVQSIIHKGTGTPDKADMAHQLYVLQCLMFGTLNARRNTPVDVSDQVVLANIQELRRIAFDVEPEPKPGSVEKRQSQDRDFKKLGFQNPQNPIEDFLVAPPGVLALSNILYFALSYGEQYTKVVLENSCRNDDHDLPFAKASIELTNVICEILKIGEPPTDDGTVYYPMFFTHERSFEEFFCICIQLVNKTWKEMKATSIDFAKVFSVVREQIIRALVSQLLTFDNFRAKLLHLTYQDITKIWQHERLTKEQDELLATPIQELKKQISPEIIDLIKKQRLNHVVNGTRFIMKHRRGEKFFYCRLSPNHKVFHYGDWDENGIPSIEQLPNKLAVVDIKELLVGKECPHVKDKKQTKLNPSLAFSLVPSENMSLDPVNFVAPSDEVFCIWTDAINTLLGKPMASSLKESDLDTLLGMEIKLRLLDTEGITIPSAPPPLPPDPPNYDFFYKDM